jgi:hypothetical protein
VGVVSEQNSLAGASYGDSVSGGGVIALSNGNYVVGSPQWSDPNNPGVQGNGAATWGDGATGTSGRVSAQNSLIGTSSNEAVGYVIALTNGNYVVASPHWNNGRGAVTWASGGAALIGTVSAQNSLIGTSSYDYVGLGRIAAFSDGSLGILSQDALGGSGAVTYASGSTPLSGTITSGNSVIGGKPGGGSSIVFDYNAVRHLLVVGRPTENMITIWDTDSVFADGFESN